MLKPTPKERVLFVRKLWLALLVLLGVFSLSIVNFGRSPLVANAAAANTINFQARLQSNTGAIVPDGNYNIEFKIYDASSSSGASQGSCTGDVHCLWTETRTSTNKVQVINGYLSVNLGSVTAFSGINWDQQLWMTMNIGGTSSPSWDGEMSPRLTLTAVPYAFAAGQLNTTSGSNRSTLSIQAPTGGNQSFVIQDQGATGTYNLLTSSNGVQLQGSTPGTAQTGNLNISGTGVFGTAISTAQLTATGQSILGGGSNQTQLIVKANSSQTTANPLILLKDSSNAELARITADSLGDLSFGFGAGGTVTSGSGQNTAFGSNALLLNTSGSVNTAFGALAGSSITGGSGNTALGYNAYANGTANNNVAVGRSALTNIVGGDSNIGIGNSAGYLTNGSTGSGFYQNIFLGATAGSIDQDDFATVNTLHDAAAIGTYAQVQTSNTLVLGGVNTGTAVNGSKQQQVVIGTTMPVSTNIFGVSPMVYNAGTASQSGSTITGSSTSWSTGNGVQVGMHFIFANGTDAGTITAINSITSLTVSTSQTVSGQKYRIHNIGFQIGSTGDTYLADTSTTAFRVQNAGGTNVLTVNTSTAGVTVAGNISQSTGTISLTGNGASQISTSSGTLTLDAATTVNVGTTNATGVTVGNTSNTSAFLVQGTAGATYTIGTSGNTGGITIGNSTDSNTIAIGNAATATGKIQNINIGGGTPVGTGKAVVAIGNESNASSVTLQSGTGSVNLFTNGGSSSTTGTIVKSDTNNSTAAFQVQNASAASVFAVNTSTAGVTVTGNISQSTGTISLTGNGASQVSTTSGALTLDAATTVNVGTTNATGVTAGNTTNTTSLLFQGAASATYTIGTSSNTGGITLGNSTATNTIAIGNAANTGTQTIQIGTGSTGAGKDTVTIGSTNDGSATTIQAGTGNLTMVTNSASASIIAKTSTNSTTAFQVQNSSSLALFNADTSTGTITIGSSAGSGSIFLNNGATVNSTLALSDFASGGSIGSAASTVDIYTAISVNQTTASQTLTIPNPTASTTYGRMLYLSNIGSTNFTVGGFPLKSGATATFVWSNTNGGASWQYAGADGASILNQSTSDQTADFRISGTGRANTKFTSPLFDSITGALSLGTSTATGVTIGGTTNTATLLLQGSTAATYTFGTSDNTGGMTIGNSTDSNTIAIGNAATATGKIQTINVGAGTPAGTGKAVVTIGNQSNASSVTLQSGTGNISLLTNGGSSSTTGTVVKSVTNNSTATFQVQNTSAVSAFNVDTTNNKITIGTSDTTGTVLVLDTKTDFTAAQTSDPTGVAGGMYYNSATGSFRCYEVDHWRDCLVSARSGYHRIFEMGTGGIDGSGGDGELISFSSGTGTLNSGEPGETGHPGIVDINAGSTSPGYNYIGSVGDNEILLGNNDYWRFETVLRLPTTLNALSTATDRYAIRAGFVEQSTSGDGTDGCFFKYSDNVNSGKWQGTCLSNTTASTCDTGTTVALATWYRLTTVVNAAGNSVDFRINGVSKCTITTNIPTSTGRQTGRGVSILKTAGTNDRAIDIDYEEIEGQFGTPR